MGVSLFTTRENSGTAAAAHYCARRTREQEYTNFELVVNYEQASIVTGPSRGQSHDVKFEGNDGVYKIHADDVREVRSRQRR